MDENKFNKLSKKLIPIINNTKKNWAEPNDKCIEITVMHENFKLKSYVGKDHNVMKFIIQKFFVLMKVSQKIYYEIRQIFQMMVR